MECFEDPFMIRFSQGTIGEHFKDEPRPSIFETLEQIEAGMEKRKIALMHIVRRQDGILVTLDNRRLAVYKMAKRAGQCGKVKVLLVRLEDVERELRHKSDSMVEGRSFLGSMASAKGGAEPTSPHSTASIPKDKSFGAISVGAKSEGEKSNGASSVKSAISGTSPNGASASDASGERNAPRDGGGDGWGGVVEDSASCRYVCNLIAMKAVGGSPGGLKAAIPPKIFRPSRYQGALLLPSGEIHLESSMERHKLVEEFGLKPRDIAALVSKTRRGFDLNVRRGGTVLSLGRDGPAVVVANATALILPRGTEIQTIGHRIQQKYAELVDFSLPAAGVARGLAPVQ
eukprot:g29772.t1